jgi:hypothetical protein
VDDPTSHGRDPRAALIDELDWLRQNGLIDSYQLTPSGDVGEVVISEPAAQLARDGRQPVVESGFLDAVRSGPAAARAWLAEQAGIPRRRGSPDRR